jgi:hypothetical protein
MTETDSFLFVSQLTYTEVFVVDDEISKVSVELDNEVEKGSNKLVVAFPGSEPKTYSSSWYFNYDDFKTKGNKTFVIMDNN